MKAGWEVKALGEVCRLQNGFAFKSKLFKPSGMPVLRISSIQNEGINDNRPVFTDPADYREDLTKYEVVDGDLLIAMSGATTGKIGFNNTGKTFLLNQRVGKFEPSAELSKAYLYYFLSTKVEENLEISAGAAQPNLSTAQIKEFQLPIPPLEEQKQIVAVLDAAFEGLTRAKENAEANLQNARELFEASVGSYFNPEAALKAGIPIIGLSKLARLSYGYTEKAVAEPVGPKFLRITDIQDGAVNWDTVPHCKIDAEKLPKYLLERGDIVFARTGATTGKSYLIDQVENAIYASYLIRLQIMSDDLEPRYLAYYFQSDRYWEDVKAGTEGAAQGGFNASKLGAMTVPVPNIEEQRTVAKALDLQAVQSYELQRRYRTKLTDIAQLRQSLLQKAFAGELT